MSSKLSIISWGSGGVVSQSAQFAPFSHDYVYANDTTNEWEVFNMSIRDVIEADHEASAEHACILTEAMPFSIIGSTEDVKTPDGRIVKGHE
jgi:hypothetical protein